MRETQAIFVMPPEGAEADAWQLFPSLACMWGRRVRVTVEDLDSQEPEECICSAGADCDAECRACADEPSCLGGR